MDLHDLAADDLVSAAAAAAIGIDGYALRRLQRTGTIRRIIRGWYAVCEPGAPRPPWEGEDIFDTARRRHRLLTVALLKSFDGRVVASHQSALVLHGIPLWRADLATAHLCRTSSDHTRHRRMAVIHPTVALPAVRTGDGFATVPVAHAVVQVGLYPPDEPARRTPMDSLIAADSALHHGLITPSELGEAVAAHAHHAGIAVVRALLVHADGRHETPGETRLAHSLRRLGYRFTPQVPLPGIKDYRGDFGLEDEPVVIEFDGITKYTLAGHGADAGSRAAVRQHIAAEKRREEDIRRHSGHEFARFGWAEVDDLPLVHDRVEAARARARRRRSA